MASFKGRESSWRGEFPSFNIGIEIFEELNKRIRITFRVTTGVRCISTCLRMHNGRVFNDLCVGLAALSYPERIRLFRVPCYGAFATINFKPESGFASRAYLRNGAYPVNTAF